MVAVWCSILSVPTSPVFFCLIVTHVELPSVRTGSESPRHHTPPVRSRSGMLPPGASYSHFPDAPRHGAGCLFSPDGRWLAVAVVGTGWELLETTSWSTKIRLGNSMSAISFSPDSAIVAIEHDFESRAGSVTLVESSSGRELAQIDDPDGARAAEIVFGPDGTQMIATLLDQPLVRIWDLRSVRRDRPSSVSIGAPARLRVRQHRPYPMPRISRLDHRLFTSIAASLTDGSRSHRSSNASKRSPTRCALQQRSRPSRSPRVAGRIFQQPRMDVDRRASSQPRAGPRTPSGAAGRCAAPENENYLNTLGVALCRNGRHAEAVPILERSLAAANNSTTPSDLFCLVVCHAKQGNLERARAYFERALKWVGADRQRSEELKAFRGEAEAALHAISEKP